MSLDELEGMLIENADEPYAALIARSIMSAMKKERKYQQPTQLQRIIENTLKSIPNLSEDEIKKSCQRCFQALRIDVNHELEALDDISGKAA